MTRPDFILASGSQIRATLLRNAGIDFRVVTAAVDEGAIKAGMLADDAKPRDIVDALAEMKAFRIAQRNPLSLVLGSDQILVAGGRIYDKPVDVDEARTHLSELRGQPHQLLSAAVVFEDMKPVWRHIGTAHLTMRDFSDGFLDSYIERHGDDLLATVGCYKLEDDGPTLFSQIRGDYFSILGLPLLEVLAFLRTREVAEE